MFSVLDRPRGSRSRSVWARVILTRRRLACPQQLKPLKQIRRSERQQTNCTIKGKLLRVMVLSLLPPQKTIATICARGSYFNTSPCFEDHHPKEGRKEGKRACCCAPAKPFAFLLVATKSTPRRQFVTCRDEIAEARSPLVKTESNIKWSNFVGRFTRSCAQFEQFCSTHPGGSKDLIDTD